MQFGKEDIANVVKRQISTRFLGTNNIVSVGTRHAPNGKFTVKIGVKYAGDVAQVLAVLRASNISGTFTADQTCIDVVGIITTMELA